jgi:hypothetical protein
VFSIECNNNNIYCFGSCTAQLIVRLQDPLGRILDVTYDESEAVKVVYFHENQTDEVMYEQNLLLRLVPDYVQGFATT